MPRPASARTARGPAPAPDPKARTTPARVPPLPLRGHNATMRPARLPRAATQADFTRGQLRPGSAPLRRIVTHPEIVGSTHFAAAVVSRDRPRKEEWTVTQTGRVVNRAFYSTPPPEPSPEPSPRVPLVDKHKLAVDRRRPIARERLRAALAELPGACACDTPQLYCDCGLGERVRVADLSLMSRHDPRVRAALGWGEPDPDALNAVEAAAKAWGASVDAEATCALADVLERLEVVFCEYLIANEPSPEPSPEASAILSSCSSSSSSSAPSEAAPSEAAPQVEVAAEPAAPEQQQQPPTITVQQVESHAGVVNVLKSPVAAQTDDDWVRTEHCAPGVIDSLPQLGALVVSGRRRSRVRKSSMRLRPQPDPWRSVAAVPCDQLDFRGWRRRLRVPARELQAPPSEVGGGEGEGGSESGSEGPDAKKQRVPRPTRVHDGACEKLGYFDGNFGWSCCMRVDGADGCKPRPRSPRAAELSVARTPRAAEAPADDPTDGRLLYRADSYNTLVHLHSSKEAQVYVAELRGSSSAYLVR